MQGRAAGQQHTQGLCLPQQAQRAVLSPAGTACSQGAHPGRWWRRRALRPRLRCLAVWSVTSSPVRRLCTAAAAVQHRHAPACTQTATCGMLWQLLLYKQLLS